MKKSVLAVLMISSLLSAAISDSSVNAQKENHVCDLFFVQGSIKRGKGLSRLKEVLGKIIRGQQLEAQYRDHVLVGQYEGTLECHIEPDWLLIYELAQNEVVLTRTGTHAERRARCICANAAVGV